MLLGSLEIASALIKPLADLSAAWSLAARRWCEKRFAKQDWVSIFTVRIDPLGTRTLQMVSAASLRSEKLHHFTTSAIAGAAVATKPVCKHWRTMRSLFLFYIPYATHSKFFCLAKTEAIKITINISEAPHWKGNHSNTLRNTGCCIQATSVW